MRTLIAVIIACAVFMGWLSLVGNPHVVETVIGLVLAVAAGIWCFIKVGALLKRFRASASTG